jgi:hypothetical protein
MFSTIRNATLSALVGLGALAALPATAQAESIYFGFGGGHNRPGVEFFVGGNGHAYRPGRHHVRRDCTPRRAVNKASRMGLRNVYVRNNNPNRIRVEGRKRGERIRITFAKAPGCPVIASR